MPSGARLIGSPCAGDFPTNHPVKSLFLKVLGSRQGGTLLLATSYVLLGTLLRLGLLVATAGSVSWGLPTFAALFIGLLFDLFMAWFLTLPLGLLSAVWPASWSASQLAASAITRGLDLWRLPLHLLEDLRDSFLGGVRRPL